MAEITFDQDQIIKNVNGRITQDLAAAIKQVAKCQETGMLGGIGSLPVL